MATYVSYQHIVRLEQLSSVSSYHHRQIPLVDPAAAVSASASALAAASATLRQTQRHHRSMRYHLDRMLHDPSPSVRTQFVAHHTNATAAVMSQRIDEWRQPDPRTFLTSTGTPPTPFRRDASVDSEYSYDIWNCPTDHVPHNYPYDWNALDVLHHWNPDVTQAIPLSTIHQSLCVWDWRNPSHQAAVYVYQAAEVPFVLRHHEQVVATAFRWSTPGYLASLLQTVPRQRNEHSNNNHFMFWRLLPTHLSLRNKPGMRPVRQASSANNGFVPPTDNVELTFAEWSAKAERLAQATDAQQVASEHWYYRLNAGLPKTNLFLYDELPMFQPAQDNDETTKDPTARDTEPPQSASPLREHNSLRRPHNLFMVDSTQQRGINCRFGMRGVIAEAHFDPTRNWILVLSGQRRYILAHPNQCRNLELYPKGHPSGRHSSINWSTIAQKKDNHSDTATDSYTYTGPFAQARLQEVVLQGGDALYLPTSWFHFIVSLSTNYQCNARSGETLEHRDTIRDCGFDLADKKYHPKQPPPPPP